MTKDKSSTKEVSIPVISDATFETAFVGILVWFITGVLLDVRSHTHGADETFFTLEHAVFYSAFLAMATLLGIVIYQNRESGATWREAIPPGFGWSIVGIVIFAVGGVGDMLWHEIFGVEADIEALLSPTHLLLTIGAALFVSGPIRASWRSDYESRSTPARYAPIVSASITLSIFTFITLYIHPVTEPVASVAHPAASTATASGLAGILVHTAVLMGFVLVLILHFEIPRGSLTILLTSNSVAMSVINDQYLFIPVFITAGLTTDLLYWWLKPSLRRRQRLRVFAAAVPLILYSLYFGGILVVTGIAWTVHLWTGAIVSAGIVGLLVAEFAALVQNPLETEETDDGVVVSG